MDLTIVCVSMGISIFFLGLAFHLQGKVERLEDKNHRLKTQLEEIEKDVDSQFIREEGASSFIDGWNSALDAVMWKIGEVKIGEN